MRPKLGTAIVIGVLLCVCAWIKGSTPSVPAAAVPAETLIQPAPPESLFRFVVYGDTRDGHAEHRAIIASVVLTRPSLVLQTGDLVADSSVASQWAIFDAITRSMRSSTPYYPARGNHDNEGGAYFEKYMPTTQVHRQGYYYSFDRGRIHFVAIDTEDSLVENGPQYSWLEADMAKAKEEGRFIIPFYHKAIYSIGPHSLQSDVQAIRPVLHDLFRKNGVKLVFQGHDHQYYRTLRDGIVYVVTGGGGAPLYSLRHPELAIPGDVSEVVHHFCVGDVFEDRIEVTVYRMDLSRLDSFTVAVPPP